MKIKICWYDYINDKSFEKEGNLVFDNYDDFEITKIVDKYEDLGITIDQGGDQDYLEFDLPDWDMNNSVRYNDKLVSDLISELETAIPSK